MAGSLLKFSSALGQRRSADSVYCLSCGERLADRSVLRVNPTRLALSSSAHSDDGEAPVRPYLRCLRCGARNFFIKEYAYGRAFWQLSHCRSGEPPASAGWSPDNGD